MLSKRLAAAVAVIVLAAPAAVAVTAAGGSDVTLAQPPPLSITVTTDEPTRVTVRDRSVPVTIPDWVHGRVGDELPDDLEVPRDPEWIAEEIELVSDLMTEGAIDNWTDAEDYIQELEDLLDEIAEEGDDEGDALQTRRFQLWCYFSPFLWWYCMR